MVLQLPPRGISQSTYWIGGEYMKVRFIGDDTDQRTQDMGIRRNAVFQNAELKRVNFFQRLLKWELILNIKVLGQELSIPYGSMQAFDRNWEIL